MAGCVSTEGMTIVWDGDAPEGNRNGGILEVLGVVAAAVAGFLLAVVLGLGYVACGVVMGF